MSDERPDGPAETELRASDAERDVVATRLREAHAEGRLTVEEFSERLDAALAAPTRGDLEALTRDLPAATAPARRRPRTGDEAAPARRGSQPTGRQAAWGVMVFAVLVNLVVWGVVSLANGDLVYFWPAWVAGPWGAVLLIRHAGRLPWRCVTPAARPVSPFVPRCRRLPDWLTSLVPACPAAGLAGRTASPVTQQLTDRARLEPGPPAGAGPSTATSEDRHSTRQGRRHR